MNMIQMMQQAQKMQKKLKEVQDELNGITVEGKSGSAVTVTLTGQSKFKSIKLQKSAINPENPDSVDDETIELLEDLITQAMNNAYSEAQNVMEAKMKAVTGGISIPGLF
ncbi:MAG: YbaB/EbfC family nucleoid-associated protein [Candidatus Gastranaerophilales bacterium]|nr:YbaB/EbfC family nucleoid-associated protein [Candidatus Gastranaerophilales bacterium]